MTDDVPTIWPDIERRDPTDECWSCLTHSDDPPTSGAELDERWHTPSDTEGRSA